MSKIKQYINPKIDSDSSEKKSSLDESKFEDGDMSDIFKYHYEKFVNNLPLDEFLNEEAEVHALAIGFFGAWKSIKMPKLPKYLQKQIEKEYHYYLGGMYTARFIQIAIAGVCGYLGVDTIII